MSKTNKHWHVKIKNTKAQLRDRNHCAENWSEVKLVLEDFEEDGASIEINEVFAEVGNCGLSYGRQVSFTHLSV